MWVSMTMCFSRALDSYFIVKMPPYSLAKIATRGVRPGYVLRGKQGHVGGKLCGAHPVASCGEKKENKLETFIFAKAGLNK